MLHASDIARLAAPFMIACTSDYAAATAQRTFVASTGVDNPSCSLVAPCRAFVAAVTAANPGGEVVVLDSAGYGSVTVTKSVSIITPPGIHAGISVFAGFDGVTIMASGGTVVLRGLSISGQGGGKGVNILQAAAVRIENCVIANMLSSGIGHGAAGGKLIVLDTIIRDNADNGIFMVAANASLVLDRVRIESNQSHGLYLAPTPGGVRVRATISDSLFVHNALNGVNADAVGSATTFVAIERSQLSSNGGRGFEANVGAAPGAQVEGVLARNSFHDNASYGFLIHAVSPGIADVFLSDNSVIANNPGQFGFNIDGDGARGVLTSNVGQGGLCSNLGELNTYGTNSMGAFTGLGTCVGGTPSPH